MAKLLRRLAEYIDENGLEEAVALLRPKANDIEVIWRSLKEARGQSSIPSATPESPPERRLIPVSKWSEYHDWPSEGGLRHLVFYSEYNGFDKAIRRVGRRVLIDEQAFFKWVDTDASKPWKLESTKREGHR